MCVLLILFIMATIMVGYLDAVKKMDLTKGELYVAQVLSWIVLAIVALLISLLVHQGILFTIIVIVMLVCLRLINWEGE